MTELKPCPFCGGEAKIELGYIYKNQRFVTAYCENPKCKAQIGIFKEDEIADVWNRRVENNG